MRSKSSMATTCSGWLRWPTLSGVARRVELEVAAGSGAAGHHGRSGDLRERSERVPNSARRTFCAARLDALPSEEPGVDRPATRPQHRQRASHGSCQQADTSGSSDRQDLGDLDRGDGHSSQGRPEPDEEKKSRRRAMRRRVSRAAARRSTAASRRAQRRTEPTTRRMTANRCRANRRRTWNRGVATRTSTRLFVVRGAKRTPLPGRGA